MKIKISNKGVLYLDRGGELKPQFCPFDKTESFCGDWCPLFDESSLHADHPSLELCRAFYDIDLQVIDER